MKHSFHNSMKCLIIFFTIAQISKTENEISELRLFTSKEPSESGLSNIFRSSEENSTLDDFLRPPYCGKAYETNAKKRFFDRNLAKQHQFPWIAALGYEVNKEMKWNCSGALITGKHVLTAAHCIFQQEKILKMVRVGALDIFNDDTFNEYEPGQDIIIHKKILHEKFDPKNLLHDIGMVTLSRQIVAPKVWPICLPVDFPLSKLNYVQKIVTVAGWGTVLPTEELHPLLQFTSLKVYPRKKCEKLFSQIGPNHNIMCVAHPTWKDVSCNENPGGTLMYKVNRKSTTYYMIGIASITHPRCSFVGNYAVFTEIIPYLDWIHNHISNTKRVTKIKKKKTIITSFNGRASPDSSLD